MGSLKEFADTRIESAGVGTSALIDIGYYAWSAEPVRFRLIDGILVPADTVQ